MALPTNADVVVVRGYWWDETTGTGVNGTVTFEPVPLSGNTKTTPNLRDLSASGYIKTRARAASVNPTTGYFATFMVASNDPDLDAYGGRKVTFSGEPSFTVQVPYNAPETTVDAEMAAATGLLLGSSVKAVWLSDAALVTTPTPSPPVNYLTAEQTLSNIVDAVDDHDTDTQAHPDIRELIGAGGGGGGLTPAQAYTYTFGQRVILFGTSLEALNGTGPDTLDPPSSSSAVPGRGWYHWCNAYLGQALTWVRNAGVGGNTTAQMLARIQNDVIAYSSDWVFIGGPTNDMANDVPAATTIANLTAILDQLAAAGRRVLILTAPPSQSYSTATRRAAVSDVNRWIRSLPATRLGVLVADVHRVLADPATGSPATGMAIDEVHYTDAGAARVGEAAAIALSSFVPPGVPPVLPVPDPRNVISNPHFASGTGWGETGGGVAATYSPATDSWTSRAVMVLAGITDNAAHGIEYLENISGGRFAVGNVLQAVARFRWSGLTPVGVAAPFQPFLRIRARKVDNSFGIEALNMLTASGELAIPAGVPSDGEAVAITVRTTIPASTDRLYVMVGWRGAASGTVEVRDLSVYKVA